MASPLPHQQSLGVGHDITKAVHNITRQQPQKRGVAIHNNKMKETPSSSSSSSSRMMMTTTKSHIKGSLKDNKDINMTDVALVGDDGIPIPAIRCVLGSASPVLKQLLYTTSRCHTTTNKASRSGSGARTYDIDEGLLLNSSSNSCTIQNMDEEGLLAIPLEPQKSSWVHIPGFRSHTIQSLVEYSCSDGDLQQIFIFEPAPNHTNVNNNTTVLTSKDPAQAVIEMLDFCQLAIHYEIPNVPQQIVDEFVIPLIKINPPLACIIFNYLLTVEFPDRPRSAGGSGESSTRSKSDGSHVLPSQPNNKTHTNRASKEAKETEHVVSAAAALAKLYTTALTTIRTQPYAALETWERQIVKDKHDVNDEATDSDDDSNCIQCIGGVLSLEAEPLEKVLQDKEVEADELYLFRQLLRWHNHHCILPEDRSDAYATSTNHMNHHQQHNITTTLKQMRTKATTSIGDTENPAAAHTDDGNLGHNGDDDYDDDDSFQCKATYDEFTISNAETDQENHYHHTRITYPPSSAAEMERNEHHSIASSSSSEITEEYSCANATTVCRELVHHIDLASIDPISLKEVVSKAVFVDQECLMEALWEQATVASKCGLLSCASVVRGTGGSGTNLSDVWADLDTNSNKQQYGSSNTPPPDHQYFKSHIHVQGAGVEQCNGIYTQVVQPTSATKEKSFQCSEDLHPISVCSSSSASSCSETQTTYSDFNGERIRIATGICLRFVKEPKRKHHKGKRWYLVCRRELVDPERIGHDCPVLFQHQWSIIEEDNRDEGQLRVLYEWEQDVPGDASVILSYRQNGTQQKLLENSGTRFVIDSSTLQRFPETGWFNLEHRHSPAPTCKWYRPRHGSPFLVVPPVLAPKESQMKRPVSSQRTSLLPKATQPQPPPPPPARVDPQEPTVRLADSLVGLSIISSVSRSDMEPSRKVNIAVADTTNRVEAHCHSISNTNDNAAKTARGSSSTNGNCTSTRASSAFRLSKARNHVSLADASIATSGVRSHIRHTGSRADARSVTPHEI